MNMQSRLRKYAVLAITTGIFWASNAMSAECPIIDLGTGAGTSSNAYLINTIGQMAGITVDGTPLGRHGFVRKNDLMTDTGEIVPIAMNNNGLILASPSESENPPYLWDNGVLTEIGPLSGSGRYPLNLSPKDININGQVIVNTYDFDSFSPRGAAFWDQGVFSVLPALSSDIREIRVTDINDRGQVVGYNYGNTGQRGFVWEEGKLTDLGALGGRGGGSSSEPPPPIVINNKGQVAGTYTIGGKRHAFVWYRGIKADLGTLGGLDSSNPQEPLFGSGALAINNRGQVIGSSITAKGERHAFLWNRGVMIDLGTLGGKFSQPKAINNNGLVIGVSTDSSGVEHEFLWRRGVMTELKPFFGASYASAEAINAMGQVVGRSVYPDQGYVSHATLWNTTCD
jgi:probable HAF family extracellular repeat protein